MGLRCGIKFEIWTGLNYRATHCGLEESWEITTGSLNLYSNKKEAEVVIIL